LFEISKVHQIGAQNIKGDQSPVHLLSFNASLPPTEIASKTMKSSIWKFALRHSCIIIMIDKATIQGADERAIYVLAETSTIWLMGGKH